MLDHQPFVEFYAGFLDFKKYSCKGVYILSIKGSANNFFFVTALKKITEYFL